MIDAATICDSHIMVVGCGALGNEVMKNLVLMGVQHLVVVDFDYVEQGNLTRTILYRKCDVGIRKVDAARKALLEINPELDIKTIFGDIAYDIGLGTILRMDVIVGCVDNRWARYCIQRLCHRAGKTWIDGGILDLTGTVKVFKRGETCYACSLSTEALNDMQHRMPCSGVIRRREAAGHAPTTPIIASIIGAVQAQEALYQIETRNLPYEGVEEYRRTNNKIFSYDGESLTVMTPVLEAWDEDCALHGEWNINDGEWLFVDNNTLDIPIRQFLVPNTPHRSITLNEPFVDYIVSRRTDEQYEVMLPAHKVEDFFFEHIKLRNMLMSDFYQHEYRVIDNTFPYPDITLRKMGIPEEEILRTNRTK